MSFDDMQVKNYLQQLYQLSGGDVTVEVSMYDIGEAVGLDRSEAGAVAEDIIIDGFAELKNLSGGISITAEGLRALDIDISDGTETDDKGFELGEAELLSQSTCLAVEQLSKDIKSIVVELGSDYGGLEEIVFELKTLEVQLLSNRPKTAIVREILRSLAKLLEAHEESRALGQRISRTAAC